MRNDCEDIDDRKICKWETLIWKKSAMKKIDLKSTDKSFNQKLPDENVANFQIFIKGDYIQKNVHCKDLLNKG